MKCAFVSALLLATATAYSSEFIQGAETGIFLGDEESFADYSCPLPKMDQTAKGWIEMINPVKMMMENMNGGKPSPFMDSLTAITKQLAILYSLFWGEYDGGDFCQGLIFAKEIGTIFWSFGRELFESFFLGPHISDVQEHLSNESTMGTKTTQTPTPTPAPTPVKTEAPAQAEVRHGRRP